MCCNYIYFQKRYQILYIFVKFIFNFVKYRHLSKKGISFLWFIWIIYTDVLSIACVGIDTCVFSYVCSHLCTCGTGLLRSILACQADTLNEDKWERWERKCLVYLEGFSNNIFDAACCLHNDHNNICRYCNVSKYPSLSAFSPLPRARFFLPFLSRFARRK